MANYASGDYVSVLKNNGMGPMAPRSATRSALFLLGLCADLDGDGDRDLAVADFWSDTVSVLKNNGDGTYAAATHYAAGSSPSSVLAADLDGDGDQDLAVANYIGGTVSLVKNNGDGTYAAPASYAVKISPQSVFAADLDGMGSGSGSG